MPESAADGMHPDEQHHGPLELEQSLADQIHDATAEAMTVLARPDTTTRVTVIRGYLHLCTIAPDRSYREALSRTLVELAEFAMERGRRHLAQRLLLLTDEIRASYLNSARRRAAQ